MIRESPFARKTQARQTPICRSDGRVVGHVRDGVFRKVLHSSRHFLRRPPAVAFDVFTLDAAEKAGAVHVEVTDSDTGKTYIATIADIRHYALRLDRGHGLQLALPLGRWSVDGATLQADIQAARQCATLEVVQPALFDLPAVRHE